MQTNDINGLKNRAKFRENGDCGYVLKPAYLRHRPAHPKRTKIHLSVHFFSFNIYFIIILFILVIYLFYYLLFIFILLFIF